jgi:hypothetical protein
VRGLARLISSAISSWQNTGPLTKRKLARRLVRIVFLQHFGPENVGRHQVRRELVDRSGSGQDQKLAFLTNLDDAVIAGPEHPLRVEIAEDGEPEPYVHVRGRLEALITRAAFYDLVEFAERGENDQGEPVMGVWSRGVFFPLGPAA